jgi:hypothetical protein
MKRGRGGLGKLYGEPASAEVVPKVLAKQCLNIRLIVNYENEQVHIGPPISPAMSETLASANG